MHFNDLGSGSNVDITVIPLKGQGPTKVLRGFDTPNEQSDLRGNYERPKAIQVKSGATAVLEKTFAPLSSFVTIEDAPEPMAP